MNPILIPVITSAIVAGAVAALVYRFFWRKTLVDVALKLGCADLDRTVERVYLAELREVHRLYSKTPEAAYARLDQFLKGLGEVPKE